MEFYKHAYGKHAANVRFKLTLSQVAKYIHIDQLEPEPKGKLPFMLL